MIEPLEINIDSIRSEFPLLQNKGAQTKGSNQDHPLVYFDNAATTLKPRCVVEAVSSYYLEGCANVHRGIHRLSENATALYEETRANIQNFIGASSPDDIVFTSGTTQSFNILALGWAKHHLKVGDEVLLTEMEHHANIVPWHLLQKETGIALKFVPVTKQGELDLSHLESLVTPRTKLASFSMVSNALGSINPVQQMISQIKKINPKIHIALDAAQAIAHQTINVEELGCSALAFSGHKIFGPTGTGILYLRPDFAAEFSPVFGGGDMIRTVALTGSTFAPSPALLEAGTPNIAGFIGLGAAIDFVRRIGLEKIARREAFLKKHLELSQSNISGINWVGTSKQKIPVFSFTMSKAHPHDVATILDRYGIAIRSGHHCAQPLMTALGLTATSRAALSFYNTVEEIEQFIVALSKAQELLE